MKKISKRVISQPSQQQQQQMQQPMRATPTADVKRDELKGQLGEVLTQLNTILSDQAKSNEQKTQEASLLLNNFSKQIDTTFQELKTQAAKKKDKLPGGVADKIPYDKLNKGQLEKGIKVELEHTDDEEIAKEIAGDHLGEQLEEGKSKEEQDYYDELEKMDPHHDDARDRVPAFWRRNLDYGAK
jgi:hypothetical protein